MGFKNSQFRQLVRKVTVDIFGEKLNIEYRPGAITPALTKRLNEIGDFPEGLTEEELKVAQDEARLEFDEIIKEVIVSWDYYDDEDKLLPISYQTFLDDIPQSVGSRIWAAIRKDQEVPKA